jgi:very-short-patch-repair endonuclease
MKALTPVSRKLRRHSTDAEALLWSRLRNRQLLGFKFRRQMPIGSQVADFASLEGKLVVELDGCQHTAEADAARTAAIEAAGFLVLRFWNDDVLTNAEGVMEVIARTLGHASGGATPHPDPLPMGEGLSARD